MMLLKTLEADQAVRSLELDREVVHIWGMPVAGSLSHADMMDEDKFRRQVGVMDELQSLFTYHVPPPCQIGFGASELNARLASALHSLRLEVQSHGELAFFLRSIVSFVSDYGTEYLLSKVGTVHNALLCWKDGSTDRRPNPAVEIEDDLRGPHLGLPQDPLVLGEMIANDGLLHCIHNAASALGDTLPGYADNVSKLKHICRLVARRDNQARLLERCYSSIRAQEYHAAIKSFSGNIHLERWGAVAFSVPQVIWEDIMENMGFRESFDYGGADAAINDSVTQRSAKSRQVTQSLKITYHRLSHPKVSQKSHPKVCQKSPPKISQLPFIATQVLEVEIGLRQFWNRAKFKSGLDENAAVAADVGQAPSDDEGAGYKKTNVDKAHAAIVDPYFWAYLQVLEEVASLMRQLHHYAEWCECHEELVLQVERAQIDHQHKQALLGLWSKCPGRGCRAPSLACGHVFSMLDRTCHSCHGRLVRKLPAELSEKQREDLLKEFELAKSHFVSYFTIKLSHWETPPWRMYAMAHRDEHVGRRALEACLASDHPHPKLQLLRQPPLLEDGRLWMDGADLLDPRCAHLAAFVAGLRWSFTAERQVEGLHRSIKQRGAIAPNHSEHYISYGIRRQELIAQLDQDPGFLGKIAALSQRATTARAACRVLGLGWHGSVVGIEGATSYRHPMFSKVIYHADSSTLYGRCALWITRNEHGGLSGVGDAVAAPSEGDGGVDVLPLAWEVERPAAAVAPGGGDDGGGEPVEAVVGGGPPPDAPVDGDHGGPAAAEVAPAFGAGFSDGMRDALVGFKSESIRTLFLDHMRASLSPKDSQFLTLRLRPGTLQRLHTYLLHGQSGHADSTLEDDLASPDHVIAQAQSGLRASEGDIAAPERFLRSLRGLLFVKVVKSNAHKAKRAKLHGGGKLNAMDIIVQAHAVVGVDAAHREVHVESASVGYCEGRAMSEKIPLVLSLSSLSLSDMQNLFLWTSSGLHYTMSTPIARPMDSDLAPSVQSLVQEFMVGDYNVPLTLMHDDTEETTLRLSSLCEMLDRGLVERIDETDSFSSWKLTLLGAESITFVYHLSSGRPLLAARGQTDESETVLELMSKLAAAGWSHERVAGHRKGDVSKSPYIPGTSARTWFSTASADSGKFGVFYTQCPRVV